MTTSHDWHARIMAFQWRRHPERTKMPTLKCGVCWESFSPGSDGAATFIDENGSIQIRVCGTCERLMPTFESSPRDVAP